MGQVIPVLIAGTIVIASISAVLYTIRADVLDDSAVSDPADQAEADALLDILMDSEGLGWANGVQNVSRLGLANASGLDLEKMSAVEGGRYGSTYGSGGMDYDTARAGLGIGATRDFHVRVYPIDLDQDYLRILADMETAYIGDWEELAEVVVQLGTEEQMAASAQSSLNSSMGSGTAAERQLLTDLGVDFNDDVYITTDYPDVLVEVAFGVQVPLPDMVSLELFDGDVYPDDAEYLQNVLPARLGQYDVLIVGSNVQQSQLSSDPVKSAIHKWVSTGGTLVVLGTPDANSAFLLPIFSARNETASGAAYDNDPTHPLLNTPDDLDWSNYVATGDTWDFNSAGVKDAEGVFDHVLQENGKDLLAVSAEGAFGEGRVFLSAYATTALEEAEALSFLKNIYLYADREHLYMDYGAEAPRDIPVASAVRHGHVWDDDLGQVAVRVEVLLW